jgi:hypothetical protein
MQLAYLLCQFYPNIFQFLPRPEPKIVKLAVRINRFKINNRFAHRAFIAAHTHVERKAPIDKIGHLCLIDDEQQLIGRGL